MKKILKIAKVEWNVLFYSPVAWLVLAIFLLQCALVVFDNLLGLRVALSLGRQVDSITTSIFGAGTGGLASEVQGYLYLYMPMLTMGLMSREMSSGSIKLLLSSPVKVRQIILGKYLAIIAFGLGILGIVAFHYVIGAFIVKDVDYGVLGSALLAIYLLICTYAAIGLFMSCLTSYQTVAAFSTILVFSLLRYVGNVWQDIDFVRDLTYFLSISGRTQKMVLGLITTKDVFYYLIIITAFLLLAMMRVRSLTEARPWPQQLGRYALLVASALTLGYVTSRPLLIGYLDVTQNRSLTLTTVSQDIARRFDGDLKITTYVNLLAPDIWYVLPVSRNADLDYWERYQRFMPGLKFDYVYYYQMPVDPAQYDFKDAEGFAGLKDLDVIARQAAENMGIEGDFFLPPARLAPLARHVDLESEGFLQVRQLEYRGKRTFLRFYQNDPTPYAFEPEINAALKRLLIESPKVVFLAGNNQRSIETKGDRAYQLISQLKVRRQALINQGFDVTSVDLERGALPADTNIVVLGDPAGALSEPAKERLASYLEAGGNLMVTSEPGRQGVLNPWLQSLGVQFKPGVVLGPDKTTTPGFFKAELTAGAAATDLVLKSLRQGGESVGTQGAVALDYSDSSGFSVWPLLQSPAGSVNHEGVDYRSLVFGDFDPSSLPAAVNPQHSSGGGVLPVAVAMTRKINGREQRIVVSGDADFMSNGELSRTPRRGANEDYMLAVFRWLSNGEFPIDTPRPPARDVDLLVTREALKVLAWISKAALPALLVFTGMILLFRRRRR